MSLEHSEFNCSTGGLQTAAFTVHLSRLFYGTTTLILTGALISSILKLRHHYHSFFYTMFLLGGLTNIPLFYLGVFFNVTLNSPFCDTFLPWWNNRAGWHVPFFICFYYQTLLHMLITLCCSLNRLTIVLFPGKWPEDLNDTKLRVEVWTNYAWQIGAVLVGLTFITYFPLIPTTPYVVPVPYFIFDYVKWWEPYSSSLTSMLVVTGLGIASFISTLCTIFVLCISKSYRRAIFYWNDSISHHIPYLFLLMAITTDVLAFNSVWSLLLTSKELRAAVKRTLRGEAVKSSVLPSTAVLPSSTRIQNIDSSKK